MWSNKYAWYLPYISIYDLAPTILYLFDVPIPEDMDGRLLKEIFKGDSNLEKKEVKYIISEQEGREKLNIQDRINQLKESGSI